MRQLFTDQNYRRSRVIVCSTANFHMDCSSADRRIGCWLVVVDSWRRPVGRTECRTAHMPVNTSQSAESTDKNRIFLRLLSETSHDRIETPIEETCNVRPTFAFRILRKEVRSTSSNYWISTPTKRWKRQVLLLFFYRWYTLFSTC